MDNVFQYAVGDGNIMVQNGLVPAPTGDEPVIVSNRGTCRVSFGGISIANEKKNFTATAIVTIQGLATGNGKVEGIEKDDEILVRATTKTKIVFNIN